MNFMEGLADRAIATAVAKRSCSRFVTVCEATVFIDPANTLDCRGQQLVVHLIRCHTVPVMVSFCCSMQKLPPQKTVEHRFAMNAGCRAHERNTPTKSHADKRSIGPGWSEKVAPAQTIAFIYLTSYIGILIALKRYGKRMFLI